MDSSWRSYHVVSDAVQLQNVDIYRSYLTETCPTHLAQETECLISSSECCTIWRDIHISTRISSRKTRWSLCDLAPWLALEACHKRRHPRFEWHAECNPTVNPTTAIQTPPGLAPATARTTVTLSWTAP